jgi:glycosyltransferase involved in cell wall biosynthesis
VKYFNPNSIDDFLKKMQEVLDSNGVRKSLREKGFIQAKKFNWDITAQKTLEVLKG